MLAPLVDIHCHLAPAIDDGPPDFETSLAMARLAEDSGTHTIIATPHQLGNFSHNHGAAIRRAVADLQRRLAHAGSQLQVLPGADVRIEDGMIEKILSGEVLTLADRRKHVLLELPHELYFPLESLLDQLRRHDLVGILSHPERNQGILQQPDVLPALVDAGCLMQVTAGSLVGGMGRGPQRMAEWMLSQGLVHFIASDAHGIRARRPRMNHAFQRVVELAGPDAALEICSTNPAAVAAGQETATGRREMTVERGWRRLFRMPRRTTSATGGRSGSGRKAA